MITLYFGMAVLIGAAATAGLSFLTYDGSKEIDSVLGPCVGGMIIGMLWPVAIPMLIGLALGRLAKEMLGK